MLPKYKYLLTYRYSEIVHDLTVDFCGKFLISKPGDLSYLSNQRTKAQMDHAARSGKQNIVEGVGQGQVSKKGEIKLLGVALASIEELIIDFEDFLRQHKMTSWDKNSPEVKAYRQLGIEATRFESPKKLILPNESEKAANLMLSLCHQLTFLLNRQIKAMEEKLITEGGYSENLYKKRIAYRSQK